MNTASALRQAPTNSRLHAVYLLSTLTSPSIHTTDLNPPLLLARLVSYGGSVEDFSEVWVFK